jgi:hypothetical protein
LLRLISMRNFFGLLIVLIVIISGCSEIASVPSPTLLPTSTLTLPTTATPSLTKTVILKPSQSLTPSATSKPTTTLTLTMTPTLTQTVTPTKGLNSIGEYYIGRCFEKPFDRGGAHEPGNKSFCLLKIEVRSDKTMVFYISDSILIPEEAIKHIEKIIPNYRELTFTFKSFAKQSNDFTLIDDTGYKYYVKSAEGTLADDYELKINQPAYGALIFEQPQQNATSFTFKDNDNGVEFYEIILQPLK